MRPEYCLLAWSLIGLPRLELIQRVEVLLLLADLELKDTNNTFVSQPLCSLTDQHEDTHINTKGILVLLHWHIPSVLGAKIKLYIPRTRMCIYRVCVCMYVRNNAGKHFSIWDLVTGKCTRLEVHIHGQR